jgi:hypothetical protein
MPKQDDYAGVLRQPSMRVDVDKAYLLALAERWLRPADQIDCVLRRWLIPAPFKASRSLGPTPLLRRSFPLKHSGKVSRSMPHKQASIRNNETLSEVQAAIGWRLRAEYALEQSIPAPLANLLKQFEQRNHEPETMTGRLC